MLELETQIDSFSPETRRLALEALALSGPPVSQLPGEELFNMHIHSFFSYNINGYSPSRVAWEARKAGLYAAGLCDFDLLDGLEEFIEAGLLLGLRTTVHIETRAYFSAFSDAEINSPGEPGVSYVMGSGFGQLPTLGSRQAEGLADLRERAAVRNKALISRVNSHLPEIAVDYERDVAPLTPSLSPTERHIVRAYRTKSEAVLGQDARLFEYWADLMKTTKNEMKEICSDISLFEERIRSALLKAGGLGYEQPNATSFPPIEEFIGWTLSCGAIPTIAWLDGMSEGESDEGKLFETMRELGAGALNIIPDRNHNIPDPSVRTLKLKKLDEAVKLARQLNLPINIGTEMNKAGQPFADNTSCAALCAYHADFLKGARIMVGHSILSRYCGYSYAGPQARSDFRGKLDAQNDFFESVGALPPLTASVSLRLEELGKDKAFDAISKAVRSKSW